MIAQLAVIAMALAVSTAQHGYAAYGGHGGYGAQGGYGGHGAAVVGHATHAVDYHAHPKYHFEYAVADHHTGDIKNQHEERDGDVVKGSYSLHEADGTVRTVEYTADDHNGFNAVVHRSGHGAHPQAVHHQPIVHHQPVVHHQPIVHHQPVVHHQPIVQHQPIVHHQPVVHHQVAVQHQPLVHHQAIGQHHSVAHHQQLIHH